METTTAFDLNQAVQRWRDNLAQSPAFRRENLDELEEHLRDSVATMQTCGLSTEEAFMVAAKRIGRGGVLEKEYAKVNARAVWMDRALWIIIGMQIWIVSGYVSICLLFLTNILLPKVNGWLAAYGFGRMPEFVPVLVLSVITIPLTVLIVVKVCSMLQRWAERRGWSPFTFILNRPRLLAATYGLLLCLSEFTLMFGSGWLVNRFGTHALSAGEQPTYISNAMIALQAVFLAGLVMVIARRRLRLRHS